MCISPIFCYNLIAKPKNTKENKLIKNVFCGIIPFFFGIWIQFRWSGEKLMEWKGGTGKSGASNLDVGTKVNENSIKMR